MCYFKCHPRGLNPTRTQKRLFATDMSQAASPISVPQDQTTADEPCASDAAAPAEAAAPAPRKRRFVGRRKVLLTPLVVQTHPNLRTHICGRIQMVPTLRPSPVRDPPGSCIAITLGNTQPEQPTSTVQAPLHIPQALFKHHCCALTLSCRRDLANWRCYPASG